MKRDRIPQERPGSADGRNIDLAVGALDGEAAEQRVKSLEAAPAGTRLLEERVPSDAAAAGDYYGLPLLAEPVWRWYIPTYFYVGGVAGAVAAMGAAVQLAGGGGGEHRLALRARRMGLYRLVRRARVLSTAGAVTSAALLIADLGRPARFYQMLRVFRPTSPMNVGTWIISAFGGCAALATATHVLPLPRRLRRAGDLAALGTGLMGLPLCSYTGVLVANTAVPIWQGTRRSLPLLFAASGASSAASLLELWPSGGHPRFRADRVVYRFSLAGKVFETLFLEVFAREASAVPRVGLPLRQGASGALWRASKVLSFASLAATALSRPRTALNRAAGLLGTLASLSLRFAVVQAGRASARDPRAVSEQQRAAGEARRAERARRRQGKVPVRPRGLTEPVPAQAPI